MNEIPAKFDIINFYMHKHKKPRLSIFSKKRDWKNKYHSKISPPKTWWIVFFVIAFLLVDAFLVFEFIYNDRFYPGVSIAGISVGGKSLEEVLSTFDAEAEALNTNGLQINIKNGDTAKKIYIPTSEQGLTPEQSFEYFSTGDHRTPIREAFRFGRNGNFGTRIKEQLSLFSGKNYEFSPTIREDAVASYLARELEPFLKVSEDAHFEVGARGNVSIVPEKIGDRVDMKKVMNSLKRKLSALDSSSESFSTEPNIPITTEAKLRPFTPLAKQLTEHNSLYFRYGTRSWKVRGKTLASWLVIKNGSDIDLDYKKLDSYLSETVAAGIDNPAQNSRFEIRKGKLEEIVPGKEGSVVDTAKALKEAVKIIALLKSDHKDLATASDLGYDPETGAFNIDIQVIVGKPRVTKETIIQYKITDLVGSSKTSFKGSTADRIKNITVGASKLNGLLIAPGEEFSTVDSIGSVSAEQGYTKEYVIKDNKSVKEYGGGLCQIATTLFRATLNAGLPITERANHRYVVGYYGAGLDATIYGPHPDLRFVNDTEQYLLLQSRVKGTDLIFEFYGKKDGRKAETSEPILTDRIPAPVTKYITTNDLPIGEFKCSETPRSGVTADVDYHVTLATGEERVQHFHSVYQPWQKVCLMGIGI